MDILLASILTCQEGRWILDGIGRTTLGVSEQSALVTEVMQQMPRDCTYEEYRPRGHRS